MRESLFEMFGSVRLVQEVSRSTTQAAIPAVAPIAAVPEEPAVDSTGITNYPANYTPTIHTTHPHSTTLSTTPTADNSTTAAKDQPTATATATATATPSSAVYTPYWPSHPVQPIPLLPNYTPATTTQQTTSQTRWMNKHRSLRSLLFGSSTASTATSTSTSTRGHARKNSRHRSLRKQTPKRRLSQQLERNKSKSQKLLCLWPLPVITRYTIAISLVISALNFFNLLHVTCSAPSYVIHRLEITNLLLSPFLFNWSLHGLLLFGWNVLILGLFEESLTHMLGGTRRFVHVLVGIVLSVCAIRQGLGYVFSKSTGWALPTLFFSDSVHECNQGIAPFLFALLTVQSLSIDDKYIMIYGKEDSHQKLTIRKVTLQLLMCLVNYTVKNILWWSLTGLLTGYLATIIIQTSLLRDRVRDEETYDEKEALDPLSALEGCTKRAIPLWRLLWSAIKKGAIVVMITLPVLLIFNTYYYSWEGIVDPATLNQLTQDRYMFTFVVMTAPRRGDVPLLSRTLESYLANWPVDPEPHSLYSRIQAIVYTHFTQHRQYDIARDRFSNDLKGQRYLKWVREEGTEMNQRLHVSKALSLASDNFQSTYVALLEDDFPVCGPNEWREIENVIYEANEHVPNHCGVFVGTGGSGVFMKPEIAKLSSELLLKYDKTPPDIVIQQCLRGELDECSQCAQTLVTSKTLLMYHIGYNTSTSEDRLYKKDEFQCGWRHPFNGDPSVITL